MRNTSSKMSTDESLDTRPLPAGLNASGLDLLQSYKNGPRIWDAAEIMPRVFDLAAQGLIEPVPDRGGAYQLTSAGRKRLELKVGDLVIHYSNSERVGYVAEIEPDAYSWDDPIYHVVWPGLNNSSAGPIAIPYRRYHALWHFERPESSDPS